MASPRGSVLIVGGGHNALVSAAYLARAGVQVTVLERNEHLGGAAVSERPFAGVDARLSRYSYLVSLLPQQIIGDLRLPIRLLPRRVSSYSADPAGGSGLLLGPSSVAESLDRIGAGADLTAWERLAAETDLLAERIFPTVLEPLPVRSELRRRVGDDRLWAELIESPIGAVLAERFTSDLVAGTLFTDGLIGTFGGLDDPDLLTTCCFLYHVMGGPWRVPVGGMGAVSGALADAARAAGARLVTGADVTAITPDGEVEWRDATGEHRDVADLVLAGVAPAVLDELLAAGGAGASGGASGASVAAEGAQVKVNVVLRRLPRLRDAAVRPEDAFAGTLHVHEGMAELVGAHTEASAGRWPDPLPVEVYCHTLSDPSILSPELAATGAHTLTLFGLQTPHRLTAGADPDALRADLQRRALASLQDALGEDLEPLLLPDADGRPCIETRTTLDLERELRLPGGSIFHGDLAWPFAEDAEELVTPAERWGVATSAPRVLLCGSGARRGGAVSGIAGANAARAALESLPGA
ncbi:MAG TPA: NAD(P)/FAD-dependent oxidoreductase [Naasia sp.]